MSVAAILAQSQPNTGVFVFGGTMMIVFGIIALAATVFWVWMLIDCLTGPMQGTDKVIWFLVIFFLHLLGAIIYYFVQRPGRPGLTG